MTISRKKMVRDVLYRTYGRKWALNPDEDEDCWFELQRCYQVSHPAFVCHLCEEILDGFDLKALH